MIGPIVTHAKYQEIAERYAALNLWRASQKRNVPDRPDLRVDNNELSAMEVYEFIAKPPDEYFLYVDEVNRRATTWTGDALGAIEFGHEFKDNLGATRVPIRVRGINGLSYYGTYFKSAGSYARVRRAKTQQSKATARQRRQA